MITAQQGRSDAAMDIAEALECAGLLMSPEVAAELAQAHEDCIGACLARWEEEQENARLRLAWKSAQRGRREARAELRARASVTKLRALLARQGGERP
ncbi:hypothetical protein ABT071_13665 [Streptomyces sp. NPDC002506]|uniref:hypothetical protein n=1 Tax=Streptomyces sp. NPDC002506 TaxID=3154536 RepID=UPI0033231191